MYRKISAIIIPSVIAIGILAYMLFRVRDDLYLALQNSIPAYLVVGVRYALLPGGYGDGGITLFLRNLSYLVSTTASTACIFVSQTVNLIVPARLGDFVRVFILKHEYHVTYSEGVSSLVVERVFDIFTVALLGAVAVYFVVNVPAWFYTIIVLPLVAGVIFFVLLLFGGKFSSKNRYIVIILTLLHEIKRASLSLKSIAVLGISSVVIWLLDIFVCVAVVMMFQQQIPLAIIVLAIVIGNLVKAIPLTPGGVGTYEISLAITFGLAGVAPADATLIAIVDHLIKNLVTLAGGIVSIYYFGDWIIPSIRTVLDSKLGGGDQPGH